MADIDSNTVAFTLNNPALNPYLSNPISVSTENEAIESIATNAISTLAVNNRVRSVRPSQVVIGVSLGNVLTYYMRAYNVALSKYVYWRSVGSIDSTGSNSGYPPIDLTNIVVIGSPSC